MQVVVRRSDLAKQPVNVIASYEDNVHVDVDAHGAGMVVLSVPASAITIGEYSNQTLNSNWQEGSNKQEIVSSEATRRIDDVFPDYSQRNAIAEVEGYILQYGADNKSWPAAANNRKAEIERCWNYVNAVRKKATTMAGGALPSDPTADSNWPTKINPYQPS